MSLCESIDTLAMAYLDDELAAEEQHELEAHLTECTACRAQLDSERSEQVMLRSALVAPPTPDLLRARIGARARRRGRAAARAGGGRSTSCPARRWSPQRPRSRCSSASTRTTRRRSARSRRAAVRQQMRELPLERGTDTAGFLHANFDLDPRPNDDSLLGTTLYPRGINGHDGAKLVYRMDLEGRPLPRHGRRDPRRQRATSSRTATS